MREVTVLIPEPSEDRLLSVKETSEIIGISEDTIYAKTSKKRQVSDNPVQCEIPPYRRNGRRILFRYVDVLEFVKGGKE